MNDATTIESIGAVTLNDLRSSCNKSVSSDRAIELAQRMTEACGETTVAEIISGATCLIMFRLMELQGRDSSERPTGLDKSE